MSAPEEPRSSACRPCPETPQRRTQCDGGQPCQVCQQSGRECTDGRDEQRQSACANVKPERIQRWAEPVHLVPGIEGGVRLQPKRDAAGRLAAFERQTLVNRKQDLRLVSSTSKARLCFPATISTENEVEEMDLLGEPVQMEADGPLLQALHDTLPREPVHPAIYLNAALRDRPAHGGSSRILSFYDTTLPNFGNVTASAYFRSSDDGIVKSASVWRRAASAGGRATAVGWGAFKPTPIDARPKSRKGKERAVDERDMSENAPSTLLRCDSVVLHTTTSPIQQLQLASYPHTSSLLLACRSHTSLDLLHLDATGLSSGESAIPASLSCFSYSGSQLNKRPISDCALGGVATGYGQPGSGLAVDTEGALFGFGLDENGSSRLGHPAWGETQPQMYRLRKRRRKKGAGGETSGMARVAWGGMRGVDAVVAVEDEVLLYDLRSPTSEIVLVDENVLSAHPPFHESSPIKVTSLLSRSPTHPDAQSFTTMPSAIHVVCTTRDVIWLDERMPGRDVMRWTHGRVGIEGKGSDTSLSLLELPPFEPAMVSAQVQRVALHSRLHPQVDIFTAELDPASSPRTLLEPYSLSSPYRIRSEQDSRFTRRGLAFVQSGTQPSALRSPSAAATKPPESQQEPESEPENETAVSSHGQDGRVAATLDTPSAPTCRMIEVGSAGQMYDRELVLATRAGVLEKEATEETDQVLVPDRLPGLTGFAPGENRPVPNRMKVDVAALVAVLHLAASRLDDGTRDEVQEVGQDQGDLVARATRILQATQGDSDGNAGATSLLELAALVERPDEEGASAGEDLLPGPGHVYGTPRTASIAQKLKASLQDAVPAILDLTPQSPPTQFDALISPMREEQLQHIHAANETLDAARIVLLPRRVEPDEPTLAPNQPQPADQDPPPMHFSYLRPQDNDSDGASSDGEEEERARSKRRPAKRKRKGPKPSLNAFGPRLLLAEWHIGADPRSYAWHNPYEGEKNKSVALDSSQAGLSRKARKKRDGTAVSFDPSSQPRSSGFPPAFQPSSSFPASSSQAYFPSLAPPSAPARPPTLQFEPRLPASSSQDWTQPTAAAATQPVISITAPLDSPNRAPPPFAGAASQVVPGAFGSRLSVGGHGVKDKKKGKKRVSGF